MAFNPGMPVPSYNDEMDGYGMHDYQNEDGTYGPQPDYVGRNYRAYPRDQVQRRDFDYNHGMNMPSNHVRDDPPPYVYSPMPPVPYNHHGPQDCGPDMYDGPGRYSGRHCRGKQRDRNFYYGHSRANVILGPNGPEMNQRPPGHTLHNGPNMHHGQLGPLMHNGPDLHHGPPGPRMHNRPDKHHGPPGTNIHNGPNMHHGSPDVVCGPPTSNIFPGPPVLDIHQVPPPGTNIPFGTPPPNFHVHPGPPNSDIHPPPPGPRPGPLPPGPDLRLGPPSGPDVILAPPPGPVHEIYPRPPQHLSPLYHSIPPSVQPITVPPPQCFPPISGQVSKSKNCPSENSPLLPPLPPSPPREARPPTPPSPSPPSPRSPSCKSSLPAPRRVDAYDPGEALFSPTGSISPEMCDKQEESILKYVKSAQKLKSSNNIGHTAKVVENTKVVRNLQEPKKTELKKPNILEESPTRPNLDARLKLMFGTARDNESPKKKEKKKSPTKSSKSKRGETKETDRPLSPPPSPFQSRQMYHYWHKVTLKLRKSFSTSSVDFVSANAVPSIQSSSNGVKSQFGKANAVNIPPKPVGLPLPKSLPTVPPPNYKSSMIEPILPKKNNLKPESTSRTVHRMHPYKIGDSKEHIVQSTLDSELEISCDISPEDGMSDVDVKNNAEGGSQSVLSESSSEDKNEVFHNNDNFEMQVDNDSDLGSKTVGIVLSKIISELKNEIEKELYGSVIDDEIHKFFEKNKS